MHTPPTFYSHSDEIPDDHPDKAETFPPDEYPYGAEMILRTEFTDYARQLAEDIGYLTVQPGPYSTRPATDLTGVWPFTCIDWEAAARDLSDDYTPVTFDGHDYLVRET